jgi:peptidoglycan/xylan/chitin deacetylase (PgdA/CDA1 family)
MSISNSSFRWPGGHRAALGVVVHVAGLGLDANASAQPELVGVDYTATGLQRLLDTLRDLDISATIAFTADAVNGSPQLIRRTVDLGHEVAISAAAGNGASHDLKSTIERLTGGPVEGVIEQLPGFPADTGMVQPHNDSGNAWRMTGAGGDLPVTISDPAATLIPYSPYMVDTAWLSPSRPLPPSSLLEAWSLALAAHRADGSLMTVVVHPHIAGRPGFADTITRFLDEAIGAGDVWISRLDHIARAWHELAPGTQE